MLGVPTPLCSSFKTPASLPPRQGLPGGPQNPIPSGLAVFVGVEEVVDVVNRVEAVEDGNITTLGSGVVVVVGAMLTLGSGVVVVAEVGDTLAALLALSSAEKMLAVAAAAMDDGTGWYTVIVSKTVVMWRRVTVTAAGLWACCSLRKTNIPAMTAVHITINSKTGIATSKCLFQLNRLRGWVGASSKLPLPICRSSFSKLRRFALRASSYLGRKSESWCAVATGSGCCGRPL